MLIENIRQGHPIARALERIQDSDPNDGHRFVLQARSAGSSSMTCVCDPDVRQKSGCHCRASEPNTDSNYLGPPHTIAVRAWSLNGALAVALREPLTSWGLDHDREYAKLDRESTRYVAQENDVIGGWCVTLGPRLPSDGNRELACFVDESMARFIAAALNARQDGLLDESALDD